MISSIDPIVLIQQGGAIGVLLGMLLQTSIIPIPWETAIFGAVALNVPLVLIVLWGTIGATLGGCVCYALGRYGGYPLIEKYGKFILISTAQIDTAQAFSKRYGGISVVAGRALPFIPFKIFSVAAGIIKVPFVEFVLFTILGMLIRISLLVWIGAAIPKEILVWMMVGIVMVFLGMNLWKKTSS